MKGFLFLIYLLITGNMYGGVATPLAILHNSGDVPQRRLVRPVMNEAPRRDQRLPALRELSDNAGHRRPECEPLLPLNNSNMKILPNSSTSPKFNYSNNFNDSSYGNGISVNYNFNNSNSVKPFDSPKSKLGHFDNLNCGNNFNGNNNNSSNNNNITGNATNSFGFAQSAHNNKGNGFFNIGLNGLISQNNPTEDKPPPPLPMHKPSKSQQLSGSRYVTIANICQI